MGSSLKIIFNHFFTISFFCCCCFFFLFSRKSQIFLYFFTFLFYTNHENNHNQNRRHWVLTEESPRLTTMDDNNKWTLLAGYYTRSFPLPAFLNDVAGIHPGLISLNEIMKPVLEFFLACVEHDSLCYNIFVSSQ